MRSFGGEDPPASAVTTAQTYAYQLRKLLRRNRGEWHGVELDTKPPGYVLRIRDAQLDVDVFRRFAARGKELIERGDLEAGSEQLRKAVDLWQTAVPIPDVPQGPLLQAHLAALAEERMKALALRIQADFALGRHYDLIGELRGLVLANPLNEWLHARLIEALHAVGRRGEALAACENLRRILCRELGVDLSAELRDLQRRILVGEPPEMRPCLLHAS